MNRVIAYCGECGAPAVERDGVSAWVFHTRDCSQLSAGQKHYRCQNPVCWEKLDDERVKKHNAKTCNDACRAAAWKARTGYGRPPNPSQGSGGSKHLGGRANGRRKASGIQIGYRKTVDWLADFLVMHHGFSEGASARLEAEHLLRPLLSEKQRATLGARDAPHR